MEGPDVSDNVQLSKASPALQEYACDAVEADVHSTALSRWCRGEPVTATHGLSLLRDDYDTLVDSDDDEYLDYFEFVDSAMDYARVLVQRP